ncbi:hypothetical protein GIB67_025639 [Kingdonia uniflora]|uniref:Aminotransferase-like plant mobile domain-containing protein n=1 Tax=Kingdonia uniflora TaxID=39325 RepID=A0A7J7L8N8_9MAGN|nr:hypothetical protein GIB67_025639 [Kingdonia uniflora]
MANDTVPLGYLAAVAYLDSGAQYNWGSAILASLYHGLDIAVTTGGAITRFSQLLEYWFYEYCGVGHPIIKEDVKYCIDNRTIETITWESWLESAVSEIEDVLTTKLLSRKRMPLQVPNGNCEYYLGDRCWRQLTGEARIPLDPSLCMSPHISSAALQEMKHTDSQRMGNIDLFGPTTLRAGITPVMVKSASVHSLSQDFSLPGEPEEPDLRWHMEWTGRHKLLLIHRLRDPPPMSSSYGAEELWHLTHGMRRPALAESARDTQKLQQLTDELATAHRHIDSIDNQLYAHDLQLRRGRDVWVVPLPLGGGARTRQSRSGPRTRGGGTSRRGRSTGDDSQ